MPLSHVLMWTEEHGYRPVTEDEANQIYPETVSASSGIFVCAICNQTVTFISSDVMVRHFRHSSAAEKKDCEDRSEQYYGYAHPTCGLLQDMHTLPLRLVQIGGRYRLELGLLALSEEDLAQYSGQTLRIAGHNTNIFLYDITERLLPGQLTWLEVGDVPAKSYCLSFSEGSALPSQWPRQIDGVDHVTLFNAATGKRLPPFPDVEVGQEYIVTICGQLDLKDSRDVRVEYIPSQKHGWSEWKLYKVTALQFSKYAARFFLQFQATLTRCVPRIFPLWPAFIRTPHLIYHNADDIFVFIEGKVEQVRIVPDSPFSDLGNRRARIIRFTAGTRKQMVTGTHPEQLLEVGRSHILRYDYFIRRDLDQIAARPEVIVTDQRGTVLQGDWMQSIPVGGMIQISASFDGEIWLENDGFLSERRELKGGEELQLKVSAGHTLTIFQGLDQIRSIVFARPNQTRAREEQNKESWGDALLCRRLRRLTGDEVPAVHILAEAVRFFQGYRATGAWLRTRKAEGCISARALSLLLTLMNE